MLPPLFCFLTREEWRRSREILVFVSLHTKASRSGEQKTNSRKKKGASDKQILASGDYRVGQSCGIVNKWFRLKIYAM